LERQFGSREEVETSEVACVFRVVQWGGVATAEMCQEYGINSATFYKWKVNFGGLEISDIRRVKTLEDQNAKLRGCSPSRCWTTRC
jgi:putative transposase